MDLSICISDGESPNACNRTTEYLILFLLSIRNRFPHGFQSIGNISTVLSTFFSSSQRVGNFLFCLVTHFTSFSFVIVVVLVFSLLPSCNKKEEVTFTLPTRLITDATLKLYDEIVDKKLLIRRVTIAANNLILEKNIEDKQHYEQLDLFTDDDELVAKRVKENAALQKERKIQEAMIDIKFLRENPEVVKENIRNKFQDAKLPLVDEVIALDEELRLNKKRADDLRANRNKISKSIGALMAQKKFEEAEATKKLVAEQAAELAACEANEAELNEKVKNITENITENCCESSCCAVFHKSLDRSTACNTDVVEEVNCNDNDTA